VQLPEPDELGPPVRSTELRQLAQQVHTLVG
jgi:hypothetical protein